MTWFAGFAILRPIWLIALPAIAICAYCFARRGGTIGAWERAVDPALLGAMARRGAVLAGKAHSNLPLAAAALFIVLALSGPALERRDAETFRNLDATLIVVDLSHAMVDGERLQQSRIAARTIADSAGTRQTGLLVYAGDAYVASTLTTDADALGVTIFALESDTVPDRGNRPERALKLARQTLRDAGVVAADIVLISAGASIDEEAAREAHVLNALGYRLHAVQVGPGREVERRAALSALAAAGGGTATTTFALDGLAAQLRARPVERVGAGDYAVLVWQDVGRFLLIGAAFSTLLLFRKSAR